MSGIEVVAAVCAVVSAFQGGAELLAHIQKKRGSRKSRDRAQHDFDQQQLHTLLVAGERSIGLRYRQDLQQLGDYMRIGDVTARDRLFHIALLMQAEIIKSLQLALTHDSAILNLRLLHQATDLNKKETLDTLDELKQRIIMTRPMARQLQAGPESPKSRISAPSVQPGQNNAYSRVHSLLDDYIAASVALPTPEESTKPGLADILRQKRKDSTVSASPTSPSAQEADIHFSEALEKLIRSRGTEDREAVMKDVDVMVSSYQDMKVNQGSRDSWDHAGNRDTLMWLHGGDSYKQDPNVTRQMFQTRPLPPTPEDVPGNLNNHPAFKNSFNEPPQEQPRYQQFAKNPFSHLQAQETLSRWSHGSAGSDFSDGTNRNSSNSSQSSNTRSPPTSSYFPQRPMYNGSSHLSTPPTVPYQQQPQQYNDYRRIQSLNSPTYAPPRRPLSPPRQYQSNRMEYQSNLRPHTAPRLDLRTDAPPALDEGISPTHMPWPGTQQHRSDSPPIVAPPLPPPPPPPQHFEQILQDSAPKEIKSKPRYNLIPNIGRKPASILSGKSERNAIGPISPPLPSPTASSSSGTVTASRLRHASIAASVSSSNGSVTGTIGILPGSRIRNNLIRTDTIQSGPIVSEEKQILDGRPCKDNNYWGFCKGAWTIREDPKKGISARTQPSGYYNQKQVWECASCSFQGESFMRPHPTKKNKMEPVVDPRIHISMSGVRYRWMFLAKSHVKKKTGDVAKGKDDEYSYCCMFCTAEGTLSNVYGGVESLMNHIALNHAADMSELTRKKTNCIVGRTAGPNEAFDINVPIFSEAEEENVPDI